jgi:serine/threonine protein kinase
MIEEVQQVDYSTEGKDSDPTLKPLQLVSDTYELDKLLGRGAFGEVWSALNILSGEQVALKFTTEPRAITALRNEITQIQHLHRAGAGREGLVRFLAAHFQHNPPFVAMELSPLGDMGTWITKRDCMPPQPNEALLLIRPAIEGLAQLHAAGLVHRDIKPSNFLLFEDGFCLSDFGIGAVLATEELDMSFMRTSDGSTHAASSSGAGMVAGTLGFLAPEVLSGQVEKDNLLAWQKADIYSLGVTLAQLLTADPNRQAGAIRRSDTLPDKLVGLIERCVETDPEKRPSVLGVLSVLPKNPLRKRTLRTTPSHLTHKNRTPSGLFDVSKYQAHDFQKENENARIGSLFTIWFLVIVLFLVSLLVDRY